MKPEERALMRWEDEGGFVYVDTQRLSAEAQAMWGAPQPLASGAGPEGSEQEEAQRPVEPASPN